MSRATVVIRNNRDRERIAHWAANVPYGTRVEFKATKRSLPQNARFYAMLTDIARQVRWHGQKLSPVDFKFIFLDALKRELRIVPNLEGNGFVNLGRSSSDLSKQEMSDVMTIMEMFAAKHGVRFNDPTDVPLQAAE